MTNDMRGGTGRDGGPGERRFRVTNGHRRAIGDAQQGNNTPRIRGVLSPWQVRILQTLAAGLTLDEASAELDLSPNTMHTHRSRIYQALGARNAAHAVAIGYQRGLLKP